MTAKNPFADDDNRRVVRPTLRVDRSQKATPRKIDLHPDVLFQLMSNHRMRTIITSLSDLKGKVVKTKDLVALVTLREQSTPLDDVSDDVLIEVEDDIWENHIRMLDSLNLIVISADEIILSPDIDPMAKIIVGTDRECVPPEHSESD